MTFDQAQSPRLGQRTPVESTYVQIVDVTPGNELTDLIEAAWPGMMVFRNDLSQLQIYDPARGGWRAVAGGVAGQVTYVGDSMPTGTDFAIGDVWYDSANGYQIHVWDGDPPFWEQTTALDQAARDLANQNATLVEETGVQLNLLGNDIQEANYLAASANNSADTADGRVSMSDYQPGNDDMNYLVTQWQIDEVTGEPVQVQVSVPRNNGSIWFTRTRPRTNLCANPSLETDDVGWTADQASIVRDSTLFVPAGEWTLKVTNSGTAAEHIVSYAEASRIPCEGGQTFAASVYAELLSGATPPEVTLQLVWHDEAGIWIDTTVGDPYLLITDAFEQATLGTIVEPRIWVTGTAPDLATSFFVQEVCPSGSEGYEWHTGAMLIEQEDDLGRYFDGDSYDCFWGESLDALGTAHASISKMVGTKIQEIYELRDGSWDQKFLTEATIYRVDAAKLTGSVHGAILSKNTVAVDKLNTSQAQASEDLAAGDLVNVWNEASSHRVRLASAETRREAHGFVLTPVLSGEMAVVYHVGYNNLQTDLAPGPQWLSLAPGQITGQPPTATGTLVQRVGYAPSGSVLEFQPQQPIWIS